jgi:hypothetical protein
MILLRAIVARNGRWPDWQDYGTERRPSGRSLRRRSLAAMPLESNPVLILPPRQFGRPAPAARL